MLIIGQTRIPDVFETEFEARITEEVKPNWNIQPDEQLLVLMADYPKNLFLCNYGMIPFYSNSKNFIYQAPINKGDDSNKYTIKKKIIYSKPFRLPIRELRCIIPADYFIILTDNKAMLFFHEDRSTMAIGGVYDFWTNPNDKHDENTGAAVLTMNPYGIFKKLGLDYVPFLIYNRSKRWIRKKAHLNDVTEMMHPYPEKLINGYEVDLNKIKIGVNNKTIAQPINHFFKSRS